MPAVYAINWPICTSPKASRGASVADRGIAHTLEEEPVLGATAPEVCSGYPDCVAASKTARCAAKARW